MYLGISASATTMLPTNIPAEIPYTHRSAGPNGIRICKKTDARFPTDSAQNHGIFKMQCLCRAVALSNHARNDTDDDQKRKCSRRDGKSRGKPAEAQKYMLN